MSQPCPRCKSAECDVDEVGWANSTQFALFQCAQRTAARAETAESRNVEMMAQIGALVDRAEQAELERDGLRGKLAALSLMCSGFDAEAKLPQPSDQDSALAGERSYVARSVLAVLNGGKNV